MHAFDDFAVFVVLEHDAVDDFLDVSWASLPFAVAVKGDFSKPFPASGVWVDADEALEAGLFCSVESPCWCWHGTEHTCFT